ncbi:DUF6153 family protein [Streptomyces sp. NPDC050704]|uniref:DUF6153 family protein n=1 Tax=Streptomyces sp. NPDC050704 TaxID=3157219 RepID=UPI00343F405B
MDRAYDEVVTRLGQLARPQSTVRFGGLLVCALLLGLLGMHGLGPVPDMTAASGHPRTAATEPMGVMASAPDVCDHDEGGCTGHAVHADPTCASTSVAGPPALMPVLLPDVAACAGVPDARTLPTGSGPHGGRAPPSLSELQLLRI